MLFFSKLFLFQEKTFFLFHQKEAKGIHLTEVLNNFHNLHSNKTVYTNVFKRIHFLLLNLEFKNFLDYTVFIPLIL
jgi:hypothetical protein